MEIKSSNSLYLDYWYLICFFHLLGYSYINVYVYALDYIYIHCHACIQFYSKPILANSKSLKMQASLAASRNSQNECSKCNLTPYDIFISVSILDLMLFY